MQKNEKQNKRKAIDEMTKSELVSELDDIRNEYDYLFIKNEIIHMLDKMVTISELQKIHDYVEKIYKEEVVQNWGFLYGVRDNICDMADNLANAQNIQQLQYFNHLMYCLLLTRDHKATEGLYTITDGMKNALLEHILKTNDAC